MSSMFVICVTDVFVMRVGEVEVRCHLAVRRVAAGLAFAVLQRRRRREPKAQASPPPCRATYASGLAS